MIKLIYLLSLCSVVYNSCNETDHQTNDCSMRIFVHTCCHTTANCYCESKKYTYSLKSNPADFNKAYITCKQYGMELANIMSKKEEKDLINYLGMINHTASMNNFGRFWLSGTRARGKKDFYWMSNGQPIDHKIFLPGPPPTNHDSNDGCLEMTFQNDKVTWNELSCAENLKFICQRKNGCL